jgi:hypothetical protein
MLLEIETENRQANCATICHTGISDFIPTLKFICWEFSPLSILNYWSQSIYSVGNYHAHFPNTTPPPPPPLIKLGSVEISPGTFPSTTTVQRDPEDHKTHM